MKTCGWRFNGQQYPEAIHMCVTGPQTQEGVAEAFAEDLDAAVEYAKNPPRPEPKSGGVYGGGADGVNMDQDAVRRMFLVGAMDAFTDYPF
ncbi:MAG: aspartate aminotransferase family protein, partial [Candidatus Hydrogenedentota bacterium]